MLELWLKPKLLYNVILVTSRTALERPTVSCKKQPRSARQGVVWWEKMDSNHRSVTQQIYSLRSITMYRTKFTFCPMRVQFLTTHAQRIIILAVFFRGVNVSSGRPQ